MSRITSVAHWLVDAQDLKPGEQMNIYLWDHPGPPPSYQDMRAALYAQFGKDTPIRIWKHGQRICIFIHVDEDSRARFDRRSSPVVIKSGGRRTEIENGFTKDLLPPAEREGGAAS